MKKYWDILVVAGLLVAVWIWQRRSTASNATDAPSTPKTDVAVNNTSSPGSGSGQSNFSDGGGGATTGPVYVPSTKFRDDLAEAKAQKELNRLNSAAAREAKRAADRQAKADKRAADKQAKADKRAADKQAAADRRAAAVAAEAQRRQSLVDAAFARKVQQDYERSHPSQSQRLPAHPLDAYTATPETHPEASGVPGLPGNSPASLTGRS